MTRYLQIVVDDHTRLVEVDDLFDLAEQAEKFLLETGTQMVGFEHRDVNGVATKTYEELYPTYPHTFWRWLVRQERINPILCDPLDLESILHDKAYMLQKRNRKRGKE